MTPYEYWRDGHGLTNIVPANTNQPESDEFFEKLTRLLFKQKLTEFGCGVGRLAPYFDPALYIGVDICAKAVSIARRNHPDYSFLLFDDVWAVSSPHAVLAHTVMLHIPDDGLKKTCHRFKAPMVVISEILGRNWRREGNPPVFNREIGDYESAMKLAGYRLHRVQWAPYPHYRETDISILEFHRE